MFERTNQEWEMLYRSRWREPFAHLSKELRGKLVRGCRGKACYQSRCEAAAIMATLPKRGRMFLNCYKCRLCGDIHIGNSRTPGKSVREIHP